MVRHGVRRGGRRRLCPGSGPGATAQSEALGQRRASGPEADARGRFFPGCATTDIGDARGGGGTAAGDEDSRRCRTDTCTGHIGGTGKARDIDRGQRRSASATPASGRKRHAAGAPNGAESGDGARQHAGAEADGGCQDAWAGRGRTDTEATHDHGTAGAETASEHTSGVAACDSTRRGCSTSAGCISTSGHAA